MEVEKGDPGPPRVRDHGVMALDAVLITRPEPGASQTAARVVAMGRPIIVAPLSEIRCCQFRPPIGRIAAILLTSGNAVEALPASLQRTSVLTVGTATAHRARMAGFTDVSSADGDALALVSLVKGRLTPNDGTLLLAAGARQGHTLATELRSSGYRVARRVAYAAVPVRQLPEPAEVALASGRSLTVLLYSTETASHFVVLVRRAGLLAALSRCDAITIGPQAAMALSDVAWARIHVAAKPTQDDMLALLR